MDKIIVVLVLLFDSLILITSSSLPVKSSLKNEELESFIKLTLPLLKQNFINRQELDSFYNMLANNEDILLRSEHKKNLKSLDAFESVKRKHDDYGHLRFGRNDPSVPQLDARVKYNDPDYGHMRFG